MPEAAVCANAETIGELGADGAISTMTLGRITLDVTVKGRQLAVARDSTRWSDAGRMLLGTSDTRRAGPWWIGWFVGRVDAWGGANTAGGLW